jgi:hypothetical protein
VGEWELFVEDYKNSTSAANPMPVGRSAGGPERSIPFDEDTLPSSIPLKMIDISRC